MTQFSGGAMSLRRVVVKLPPEPGVFAAEGEQSLYWYLDGIGPLAAAWLDGSTGKYHLVRSNQRGYKELDFDSIDAVEVFLGQHFGQVADGEPSPKEMSQLVWPDLVKAWRGSAHKLRLIVLQKAPE